MTTPGASFTSSAIIASSCRPRLRTATAEAARYRAGDGRGKAGSGRPRSCRVLRRQRAAQHADDSLAGTAITVRVVRARHRIVGGRVAQQALRLDDDAPARGAHQASRPGGDALATFGGVTQHEHGLPERGRLLLDAPRIGEYEV